MDPSMPLGVMVPGEDPGEDVDEDVYNPAALAEWAAYSEGAEIPE